MKIAMLGSGFIASFYADSLAAQRRKDVLISVYSRSTERAEKFAKDYGLPYHSNNMAEVIENPEVDVVVIALSNDLHLAQLKPVQKQANMFYAPNHWDALAKKLKNAGTG